MKYKKITFACVLLGLSLYAGVCAATVREVADEAPASKQTIIADKKDKKLLNKKQRAVQITQEKDKIVVSTKPVAKPPAGTINVPAAPRPSLLQEKDGKFYFCGTQLPDDYRNIAIYGEAIAKYGLAGLSPTIAFHRNIDITATNYNNFCHNSLPHFSINKLPPPRKLGTSLNEGGQSLRQSIPFVLLLRGNCQQIL